MSPDGAAAKAAFEKWWTGGSVPVFTDTRTRYEWIFLAGFRAALEDAHREAAAVDEKVPGTQMFLTAIGMHEAICGRIRSLFKSSPPSQPGQPSERGTKP